MKPQLRAEGIIFDVDNYKVLVQCDADESFYRFPGGGIEFGETAEEAIKRELIEEFDLQVQVVNLAVVNESIVEYDGKQRHDCTLLHWCKPSEELNRIQIKWHNERKDVKLIWRTIEELKGKELYPEGIFEILEQKNTNNTHHIVVRKAY